MDTAARRCAVRLPSLVSAMAAPLRAVLVMRWRSEGGTPMDTARRAVMDSSTPCIFSTSAPAWNCPTIGWPASSVSRAERKRSKEAGSVTTSIRRPFCVSTTSAASTSRFTT